MRTMALLLLTGCTGAVEFYNEALRIELDLNGVEVFDPKLDGSPNWPMELRILDHPGELSCTAVVWADNYVGQDAPIAEGEPLSLETPLVLNWNGLDPEAHAFDPGLVRIAATVTCSDEPDTPLAWSSIDEVAHILRLGVTEVDFLTHPQQGVQVTLAYHKSSLIDDSISVIGDDVADYQVRPNEGADLDDANGFAREPIAPWDNAFIAPWGIESPTSGLHNVPTAYVADSQLRLSVRLGEQAVSQRDGSILPAIGSDTLRTDLPPLRLVAEGLESLDLPVEFQPGDLRAYEGEVLASTLGREDREFKWHFESQDRDTQEWVAIPGSQTTTHRIYRLAGEPVLVDGSAEGGSPGVPWIGVLEDTLPAVEGVEADPAVVLNALRSHLYDSPYIVYDPSDAAYSTYDGSYIYWDSIDSNISGWLDRSKGINLYCHSMSCLLSTLAGNLGVAAEQLVLGVGFRTNLTRAAGTDDWLRWNFNSHSVVSPDGGDTIWDASIDLDGDGDPWNTPAEAISPMGMDGELYLELLSPDAISIVNQGYCLMR